MAINPTLLTSVEKVMTDAGFTATTEHAAFGQVEALSANGAYEVHGAWQKDGQVAHLEQNSVDNADGSAEVYAPVLVVENSKGGRVAINLNDMESLASVLAGTTEF